VSRVVTTVAVVTAGAVALALVGSALADSSAGTPVGMARIPAGLELLELLELLEVPNPDRVSGGDTP